MKVFKVTCKEDHNVMSQDGRWLRTVYKDDVKHFFCDEIAAPTYFMRYYIGLTFTVTDVTPKDFDKLHVFEDTWEGESVFHTWFYGEQLYEWHDNAQVDYPEDLCWHRMISEVYFAGIEAGKKIAAAKAIEV